ncbi:hypothetical protein JCM8097_008013 [Rhodosporidiobolus ruineniae]
MPHTNNANARDRKAKRGSKKPAFLQKKNAADKKAKSSGHPTAKSSIVAADDPSIPKHRQQQTQLIRRFHAIEKQLASPALTDPGERAKLEKEREELGGLEGYQEASKHGGEKARGGETSKWLVKQIKALKIGLEDEKKPAEPVQPTILEDGTKVWPKKERRKLRLLDVGAIAGTAYADFNWIDTTSIDLNPQADHVQKCNFFDFPVPATEEEKYDLVALSLVMNFEGSLANRGHMLLHAHSYLRPSGYLYLVLPLPCLTNSRYLSPERLRLILTSTGWDVAQQHDSAKLTYWLLRRSQAGPDGQAWKRESVREGVSRNNFVIVVKPGEAVERTGAGQAASKGDGTAVEDAVAEGEGEDVKMVDDSSAAAPTPAVPKKLSKNARRKLKQQQGDAAPAEDVKMAEEPSAPSAAEPVVQSVAAVETEAAPSTAAAAEPEKAEEVPAPAPAAAAPPAKLSKNAKKKAKKAAAAGEVAA